MVIQCQNLISLYILPDQPRGNLLVLDKALMYSVDMRLILRLWGLNNF